MAERINQTLLNAARASLHHASLDDTFWEDAIRDAAYKYNLMHHLAIDASPYSLWHATTPRPSSLYIFGQLGTNPVHQPKTKLQPRAHPARYMYGVSDTLITVLNLRSNAYQQIRATAFRPYDARHDPPRTTRSPFKPTQYPS